LLKDQLLEDMKAAMKNGEKFQLSTIRLINAAIKQKEVDGRKELSDQDILSILDKMVKQRKDSIKQFTDAGRLDLADIEEKEVKIIQEYLPAALNEDEISSIVSNAISTSGAKNISEMGKLMAIIKPKVQGRADMKLVSDLVKARLS
tara:strand:- start:13709 stop:14149 length:441 start_codon:yes stop_codon:yes gene_type:complete